MPSSTHPNTPKGFSLNMVRYGMALGAFSLLTACANQADVTPSDSSLPVVQEAEHYQAHAKSYYAPPGPASDPWGPYIHEASNRFDVPERWIRAVIERESGGRLFDSSGHFTTSVPGAMGLMQLMPPTYDDLRSQYDLNDDPYDPHDNILAGTAYIRQMYDIYGSPGFLAAYNDGPGSLDSYLRRGRALPRETRRYVAAIGPKIAGYWPHNRSAADLLVSQHTPNGRAAASDDDSSDPVNTKSAQNVSSAWAQRSSDSQEAAPTDSDTSSDATSAASAPANNIPTGNSPTDVKAAWAARGIKSPPPAPAHNYTTPSRQSSDENVSDNRVTAQILPVGHRLQAQSIVAEVPASGIHYRLAPMPHSPSPPPETQVRGHWSIQVGAYSTATQAHNAANNAKKTQNLNTVSYATVQVSPIRTARGILYRARITGLNHDTAESACRHLQPRSACVVVAPETF